MKQKESPSASGKSVLDFRFSNSDIGLSFRRSRSGPEDDLVERFLAEVHVKLAAGLSVTYFKEPCLESGFPDIVGVVWHTATAEKWSGARMLLQRADIKVMHYLSQSGPIRVDQLQTIFGRTLKDSVAKLESSAMVYQRGQKVFPKPLSELYAARHIFAIEAKISEWRTALNQAFLNRWFATTSYVLLPRRPERELVLHEAKASGVEILSSDLPTLNLSISRTTHRPESYGSWLFNEGVWRAEVCGQRLNYAEPESPMDRSDLS